MNYIEYKKRILDGATETKGIKCCPRYRWVGGKTAWAASELPEGYGQTVRIPRTADVESIYNTVMAIESELFRNKLGITDIVLHDNIRGIPEKAFEGCADLQRIYIPKSVKSIGAKAFKGCSSLRDVYYEGTEKEWDSVDLHTHVKQTELSGKCLGGRPVEEFFGTALVFVPGSEELLHANIHFSCK